MDSTKYTETIGYSRPSFRVQFKKWQQSNFGDYIEYEILVQSLEGQRNTWMIYKRYTDFVKLHEVLNPFFRLQIQANEQRKSMVARKKKDGTRSQPISQTDQIVPILPPKISKQSK